MTVCLVNVGHLEREDRGRERARDRDRAEGKLGEILSWWRTYVSTQYNSKLFTCTWIPQEDENSQQSSAPSDPRSRLLEAKSPQMRCDFMENHKLGIDKWETEAVQRSAFNRNGKYLIDINKILVHLKKKKNRISYWCSRRISYHTRISYWYKDLVSTGHLSTGINLIMLHVWEVRSSWHPISFSYINKDKITTRF